MHVMGIAKFERIFRTTAGLDIDKQDLKRFGDFINCFTIFSAAASDSAGERPQPNRAHRPLPTTKGLQAQLDEFSKLDDDLELAPILDHLCTRPPLGLALCDDTESQLAALAGGISVALAHSFKFEKPSNP